MAGTSGVVTTRGTGGSERLHSICCFRTGSVLGSCHTVTLAGTLMSTLSARVATYPLFGLVLPLQAAEVLDEVLDEVSPNFVHCVRRYVRCFV